MAPTKFENSIKDTLEKRSLKPSENSWEKLSQQLDSKEKKSNSRSYWFIGIAASILLLISAGLLFFEERVEPSLSPVMVKNRDNEKLNKDLQDELSFEKVESEEGTNDQPDDILVAASSSVNNENRTIEKPQKKVIIPKLNINTADESNNFKSDKSKVAAIEIKSIPESDNLLETAKIQEVVAEIMSLQNDNVDVSDREIDSLLKAAQREIFNDKIKTDSSIKVSAESLLQDVEADMDRSFRDKVYDALINSYESVKTAVVDRKKN